MASEVLFQFTMYVLLAAVLIIFYLCYATRFLAYLLSVILQRFWFKEVDRFQIGSFALGLVGGRLNLKDVVYVTDNYAVKCVDLTIICRWWSRSVRQSVLDPSM